MSVIPCHPFDLGADWERTLAGVQSSVPLAQPEERLRQMPGRILMFC
jgi:hypothetical protein